MYLHIIALLFSLKLTKFMQNLGKILSIFCRTVLPVCVYVRIIWKREQKQNWTVQLCKHIEFSALKK